MADFIYLCESDFVYVYVYISTYTSTFMCMYVYICMSIYIVPSVTYIPIYRTRTEIARRTCMLFDRRFNTVTRTNGWKQMKFVTEIEPAVARCLCMSL